MDLLLLCAFFTAVISAFLFWLTGVLTVDGDPVGIVTGVFGVVFLFLSCVSVWNASDERGTVTTAERIPDGIYAVRGSCHQCADGHNALFLWSGDGKALQTVVLSEDEVFTEGIERADFVRVDPNGSIYPVDHPAH